MTKSGVYFICNLITNQIYIGSAVDFNHRKHYHFGFLKRNKHINKKLQNSFNKYGIDEFEFQILEFCAKDKRIEREQYYLDTLKPEFNIRKIAGSNEGLKQSESAKKKLHDFWIGKKKKPRTEEHKLNLSKSLKGRNKGVPKSQAHKDNLSQQRKGSGNPAYGTISSRRKKVIELSTNRIFDAVSLAAKEVGVTHGAMYFAINNNTKCQGNYYQYHK